jgi:hypothetical protein
MLIALLIARGAGYKFGWLWGSLGLPYRAGAQSKTGRAVALVTLQ